MNVKELKTGDIVQLKSGGPKMTIVRPYGDDHRHPHYNTIAVTWFSGCEPREHTFDSRLLKPA